MSYSCSDFTSDMFGALKDSGALKGRITGDNLDRHSVLAMTAVGKLTASYKALAAITTSLAGMGFTFHDNASPVKPPKGVKAVSPDQFWYCWRGPLNDWDGTEPGPDQRTPEAAVVSAVLALVAYSKEQAKDVAQLSKDFLDTPFTPAELPPLDAAMLTGPMKRYFVELSRETHDIENISVNVEAHSREEAERLALALCEEDEDGELWSDAKSYVGDTDAVEVGAVTEVGPV